WVFLVNLPVGVTVFVLCLILLPAGRGLATAARLDVAGAITVTASLMLAVYAIVNGNEKGWTSLQTLRLPALARGLLVRFPFLPTANVIGVLWAAAMFAWFFLSALSLQAVLGYTPLQVGLAFLPTSLIMGA